MGVCIEPPEYVIGLDGSTSGSIGQPKNGRSTMLAPTNVGTERTPPSESGDLDLVVYSLRKYTRLAAAGNPTVLLVLYADPLYATDAGRELQSHAHLFASREAGHRFLGYLRAQKERLLGLRANSASQEQS